MNLKNCLSAHFDRRLLTAWLVLFAVSLTPFAPVQAQQDLTPTADATAAQFAALVAQFPAAGYRQKEKLVAQVLKLNPPGGRALLNALLDNRLYARKRDGAVFMVERAEDGPWSLSAAVTGLPAGTAEAGELSRIRTNNRLRKALKGALAQLDLNDPDPAVRETAVAEMLRTPDAVTISALRARSAVETHRRVRQRIDTGLAVADLASADAGTRLAAVQRLEGELSSEIHGRLKSMAEADAQGQFSEPDPQVRLAAARVAASIELWRDLYSGVETLFFGLSLGSVLVLAAIGLAITFGVMGVINMAHGELIMLGAYTAYVMQLLLPDNTAAALLLSIPAAFVVAGLAGIAIERGIVRFLYGRPLETLLATFGLSLILQQTVRSIFSPLNRSVATPEFMSGSWVINDALSLTLNRLYIIAFALIVFALLMLVLKRTSLGLKVRAVAQNRSMARALGVRADWVDAATFGLGAGIAGVAGVALSQLTNVGPNLGQAYIIDSFMVVVFGGVGNLWGTLIGGMSLGVINKLLEPVSGAVLAKILVLVFLILYIQRRPGGMFPQRGRAAEGH